MTQINIIDLVRLNNSNKQFLLYDKQSPLSILRE
jgi:hypothetical protein